MSHDLRMIWLTLHLDPFDDLRLRGGPNCPSAIRDGICLHVLGRRHSPLFRRRACCCWYRRRPRLATALRTPVRMAAPIVYRRISRARVSVECSPEREIRRRSSEFDAVKTGNVR